MTTEEENKTNVIKPGPPWQNVGIFQTYDAAATTKENMMTEKQDYQFKIKFYDPLKFTEDESIEMITLKLNQILENMIIQNPEQWRLFGQGPGCHLGSTGQQSVGLPDQQKGTAV